MAAYCAVPPDDPFAISKAMFTALAAELSGPAAAGLTASQLKTGKASQEAYIGCPLMPPTRRRAGVRGSVHTGGGTLPAPRRDLWP
jgi:hypothetical protein